jgi:hypothetical protein
MAATGLSIFSVESDPRRYGFAKSRLRCGRNVHLMCGDSRTTPWVDGPARWAHNRVLFDTIVMIDHFQVPFDEGYGYDD